MDSKKRIFSGHDAAIAYAQTAERLMGIEPDFLNSNPACIPILVGMLFQSLEISIKQVGIESGLFTKQETRSRRQRSGHGIKELVMLAVEKLGGEPFQPIIMAMTFNNQVQNSDEIINQMICGKNLDKTRESYATRRLGYSEVADGDFAIINPIPNWVAAVKETAVNLPTTIEIISEWKKSYSISKRFVIWLSSKAESR
nr:hypothetical protein [uncultured Desulfobacter sp.]